MLPNISIKPSVSNSNSIIGSRAYTFLDSYVYMRNQRYNAFYEKQKEILAIENDAISIKSANSLYMAFLEEAKMLDSVVIRIRNFALRIKPDVINNIKLLIPTSDALNEFDDIISSNIDIPRMKYIKYDIAPIKYENMASFMNLYRMEISQFTSINTQTANQTNPFIRDKAASFLIDTAMKHANCGTELLEMESIKILNKSKLKNISDFFKQKNRFISTVNRDFKTFQFYLRQYSGLREIVTLMKPTELRNGDVLVGSSNKPITFNDYYVLYKHFYSMIKYMINIISYHERQFFNKIYALQGNIESYVSVVNDVLDLGEKINKDNNSLNESISYKLISLDETKSTIDKNFEPKGKLNLSSFEKVHIDENIINKYKKEYPMLKHVRCEDTDDYICDGYMWLDGENLVCTIGSCEYRDTHEKYIVSLEVMDKYKGYGLSKQLLKFAINTMKCSKLSVNKNNEVAKKVYDDFGFKVFHQDDSMYYMEYKSSLNEATSYEPLNENIIFSGNDIYKNFDKFKNGKENILLVTGLTGSGKSTLGKLICSETNAEWIELDLIELILRKQIEPEKAGEPFSSFCKINKDFKELILKDTNTNREIVNVTDQFFEYCLSWCTKQKSKKFVIEGIQIYDYYNGNNKVVSYPIIIKNTSVVKSFLRKVKREEWEFKHIIKNGPQVLKIMISNDKELKKLANSLNETSILNESYDDALNESIDIVNNITNETIETSITKPLLPKMVTLYHGSDKQLSSIKPVSVNVGTRLSKARKSSFWCLTKDTPILMAVEQYISDSINIHGILTPLVPKNEIVYPKEYKDIILKSLKNMTIYVYKKDIEKKYVSRGHYIGIDEYTLDIEVTPDFVEEYNLSDVKDSIKFIPLKEIEDIIADFKENNKMSSDIKSNIIEKLIYYNTDKYWSKLKDAKKKLNEAYDDGFINSDVIDSHNLINGNYAAHELLYDNINTENESKENIIDSEDSNNIDGMDELSNDSIEGVDDETISNFEEYDGQPREVDSICTLRYSLNL